MPLPPAEAAAAPSVWPALWLPSSVWFDAASLGSDWLEALLLEALLLADSLLDDELGGGDDGVVGGEGLGVAGG